MDNLYEQSSNELKDMVTKETLEQTLTEQEQQVAELIEDILNSDTLYLETDESEKVLVLQNDVNGKVFEAVAISAYSTLDDILTEALGEDEDEDEEPVQEQEEEGEEEEGKEKEGEEEGEEEEEKEGEKKEEDVEEGFENEEEKEATQESLVDLIYASEITVRNDLENPGLIINENSPYFDIIREALIERLIDTCETDEEFDVCEEIVNEYMATELEESGYGVADIENKEEIDETNGAPAIVKDSKLKAALKRVPASVRKFAKTKKGKAAIIGAGALGAGAAGYAGYRALKKSKTRKEDVEDQKGQELQEQEAVTPTKVARVKAQLKKAPAAVKRFAKTKKGKAAIIGAGALGAGAAGYAGYRYLKKKRAQKQESLEVKPTAGELAEGKAKLLTRLGRVGKAVAGRVGTAGKRAATMIKKHPYLATAGVAGTAGYGLKKKKEKEAIKSYRKGLKMAAEETQPKEEKQPVEEVSKVGLGIAGLAGLGIGKGIAKRAGKKERKQIAKVEPGIGRETIAGYKAGMKGRYKMGKQKTKVSKQLAKIRTKYSK